MDLAYEHLKSFAFEPISNTPQTPYPKMESSGGIPAFKFRDRDHYRLRIIHFTDTTKSNKFIQVNGQLFLGIDHSVIAISDTAITLQFYRDILERGVI